MVEIGSLNRLSTTQNYKEKYKMVNANEYKSKSKTINAEKVQTQPEYKHTLQVIGVVSEEMQDGKEKLCLCFDGTEEILVLNQTNLGIMIEAKSPDTDKWRDSQVTLGVIPSTFGGKKVQSVIIKSVK